MGKIGKKAKVENLALPLVSILLVFIFLFVFLFTSRLTSKKYTNITIGENTIIAEIADTNKKRSKGFSGRETLDEASGMIFIFDEASYHPFWMKGMNIPIDIIWIKDDEIVDITHQAQPQDENNYSFKIYKPKRPAQFVLEVNSGYARKYNIEVGQAVEGSIFK